MWSNRIVINEIISEYPGCDTRERERGEERTHRRWRYQQHGRARYHSQHTGCSYTHHTQLTHASAPRSSSLVELHKQETSYPPAPRSNNNSTSSVVSWMFARARSFRCCVRRTSASGRLDDAKVVAVLRQAVEGALCVVPTPSDRQPANQPTNQATNQDRSRGSVPATHRLGSTTDRIRWSPTTAPRAPRATRREPHLSDEP